MTTKQVKANLIHQRELVRVLAETLAPFTRMDDCWDIDLAVDRVITQAEVVVAERRAWKLRNAEVKLSGGVGAENQGRKPEALRGGKEGMKISELTQGDLEFLGDNRPAWMADNRPAWMAVNRPAWMAVNRTEWMADNRPEWMADNRPAWMADNRPAWMADNRPAWMAVNRTEWMADNRPEWMADNRPAWMADNRPAWMAVNRTEWMSANHPVWMADNRPVWMSANHPEWMAANRTDGEVPEEIIDVLEATRRNKEKKS